MAMRKPWRKPPAPPAQPAPTIEDRFARMEEMLAKLGETVVTLSEATRSQGEAGAQFRTALERAATPRPIQQPEWEDVPDEVIEKALQEGQGAALFRKLVESGVKQHMAPLRSRLDEHERALGGVNMRLAGATQKRPHWERFRGEIEGELSKINPEILRDPVKYEELAARAYAMVVGQHYDELRAEEIETSNRQNAGEAPGMHRRGAKPPAGTNVPEPEKYFSDAGFKALEQMFPDATDRYELVTRHARARGYSTAEDFIAAQATEKH